MVHYTQNKKKNLLVVPSIIFFLTFVLALFFGSYILIISCATTVISLIITLVYIRNSKPDIRWLKFDPNYVEWKTKESSVKIPKNEIRSVCIIDNEERSIRINKIDESQLFIPKYNFPEKPANEIEQDFKTQGYYAYIVPF